MRAIESVTDDATVAAIVLNWNNYEETASCLSSLKAVSDNAEVILVDNGSTDGSRGRLAEEFPWVDVVDVGRNRGFSGGMNRGIGAALDQCVDYIWILNNDVVVPDDEDVLRTLVEKLDSEPDIGIISPLIRYPDTDEVWFCRGYLDGRNGSAGHETAIPVARYVENDYIPMCAALVRRDVFDDVGLFPERYFLYYEDVDFCVQAVNEGYRLVTDSETMVYHAEGGTTGRQRDALFSYYRARNHLLFARDFSGRVDRPLFPIFFLKWLVFQLYIRGRDGEFAGIYGLFRGVVDGLLGRDGRGPYP